MGKSQIALIMVALLAVVGGVFWYQSRSITPQSQTTTPAVSDKEATVVEGGNALNVDSQEGGETVLIDLAVLEEAGFVVIHVATKDMKPGEVVGHSDLLAKDQHKDVVVEIEPEATKGKTYFAMLHKDDGDGDYGDEDEANTLKDDQGNVVQMKFTITSDPAMEEEEE